MKIHNIVIRPSETNIDFLIYFYEESSPVYIERFFITDNYFICETDNKYLIKYLRQRYNLKK